MATDCPICLELLSSKELGVTKDCGHPIHMACWEDYVAYQRSKKCPMCDTPTDVVRVYLNLGGTNRTIAPDVKPDVKPPAIKSSSSSNSPSPSSSSSTSSSSSSSSDSDSEVSSDEDESVTDAEVEFTTIAIQGLQKVVSPVSRSSCPLQCLLSCRPIL